MAAAHTHVDPTGQISVLHLAENPNDTFLLAGELVDAGFRNRISQARDAAELKEALAREMFDLLVVDLPLPTGVDAQLLDELASQRPDVRVLFRWGSSGQWATESSNEQLARSVRSALANKPDRAQSETDRRRTLTQLVKQQQAFLELVQLDVSDFEAALTKITAMFARTMNVARVSVWELNDASNELVCLHQFDAESETHSLGSRLRSFPRYLASLRRSLTLAADDARQDPRTSEFLENYLIPHGITAMLDAPVRRAGRVAGVVCLEHVGPGPRHWNVLEQCAASAAAGLVARTLEVRDRRLAEERAARIERMNAIGQVATGVAHDLKNVLTVLIGNLDLALQSRGNLEERWQYARLAQEAAQNVNRLVNELLDVGRDGCVEPRTLELRALSKDLENVLRSAAGPRATFVLVPPPSELCALADSTALARALLNLVKNAGEALERPGRITLRVAERELTQPLDGLPAGRYAVLSVDDTGAGIDPSARAQLFQPFFTTKSDHRGHGLGLATSFALMRQFGGTIRVDSHPGIGTCFEILLPLVSTPSTNVSAT